MNKLRYELQIWNDRGDLVCGYTYFNEANANEEYEKAEKLGQKVRLLAIEGLNISVLRANCEPCTSVEDEQNELQEDLLLELNECY